MKIGVEGYGMGSRVFHAPIIQAAVGHRLRTLKAMLDGGSLGAAWRVESRFDLSTSRRPSTPGQRVG